MICHHGETLLCLKLPQRVSCKTCQNKVFISLGYGIFTLIQDFIVFYNSLEYSEYGGVAATKKIP